ncbi:MAG: MopE-related protein, partial [Myxococcota bacterium]|nr:MopE-related protein [Myxococcota bacterium]
NHVYENTGLTLAPAPIWTSQESAKSLDLAWGDWDGDGDLDLAVANSNEPSRVYQNLNGSLSVSPVWQTPDVRHSEAVAWGDWDEDGHLDLAVAASGAGQTTCIYYNSESGLESTQCSWSTVEQDSTTDLAWGDWDGDGDLDLFVGNDGEPTRVYENQGPSIATVATWSSAEDSDTRAIALVDWDGDGDTDIIEANTGNPHDRILLQVGGDFESLGELELGNAARSVAVADYDRDGDLDLVVGNNNSELEFYENRRLGMQSLPNTPSYGYIELPVPGASGGEAAAGPAAVGPLVPLEVTLYDAQSDPVHDLDLEYSPLGSGQWFAASTTGFSPSAYSTSPQGTVHSLNWDLSGTGLLSNRVALRLVLPYQSPVAVAHPMQQGEVASVSDTFRAFECFPPDADGDGSNCLVDCGLDDPSIHPGAPELCDQVDSDCDGDFIDGFVGDDTDGDGFPACSGAGDCDDSDPAVFPGAEEVVDDGVDQDCNGDDTVSCFEDADEDSIGSSVVIEVASGGCSTPGVASTDGDCDDSNSSVYPGALELCDGLDSDCDGDVVDDFEDTDGDGSPDCVDSDDDGDGVADGDDCGPLDPSVYPGATELCDDIDQDCDGDTTEDFDSDNNGVLDCEDPLFDYDEDGWVNSEDCGPTDPGVHPGADELPDDGIDQDCDGVDDVSCYEDLDNDGFGAGLVGTEAGECQLGVATPGDCDDSNGEVHPGAEEACDGLDTDCDSESQAEGGEGDADSDGALACADCDDGDPTNFPDNVEICDGADNNCSGVADFENESGGEVDEDGDGFLACGDCNDADPSQGLVAVEICDDGLDNDCSGAADLEDEEACGGWLDSDGDGWCLLGRDIDGDANCLGLGEPFQSADRFGDCDDDDAGVNPDAAEICDDGGVDQDCDGSETEDHDDPDCWPPGCEACSLGSGPSPTGLPLSIGLLVLLAGSRRHRRRDSGPTPPGRGRGFQSMGAGLLVLVALITAAPAEAAPAQDHGQAVAALIAEGNCGEARELARAWTESTPGSAGAWRALGDAARCLGIRREAVLSYRRYSRLGGEDTGVEELAEGLASGLGVLFFDFGGEAFPARPAIEVTVAGEDIKPISTEEWMRFRDLPPGITVNVRVAGPGFQIHEAVLDGLVAGEIRDYRPPLVWVGAGLLQLASGAPEDLQVKVETSLGLLDVPRTNPIRVTAGEQAVQLSTPRGTSTVDIVVPRGDLLAFDPAPWLPTEVTVSGLPLDSRVRLFVQGAGDKSSTHELLLVWVSFSVEAGTGLWWVAPTRVGSLIGGAGGLFVSHPSLGSGAQDLVLTPGESASL